MPKSKQWIIAERTVDDLIDHLLFIRGIGDKADFLSPSFEKHRHDSNLFPGMDTAVSLIMDAINNEQVIGIYGDYDCDGIPGTALLYRGLKALGAEVAVYIPRRLVGYGVSKDGIDQLVKQKVKLLITVDCGITAIEEIAYAKEQGMEVIVTDHHEPHAEVPDAILLNPKVKDSTYPFRELCGTGVVFKLLESLDQRVPGKLGEGWLKWHLDLVALATICDMVPLHNENRMFATFGLKVLQKTRNVGLQALLQVAGVDPEILSAGTVGFGIGPRINAAGRMDEDPLLGFELLMTSDKTRAQEIAHRLHTLNLERQTLVTTALEEAESMLSRGSQKTAPAIALHHPSWTPGILGLIASRLLEKYHRPVFIFEGNQGTQKGSARSIEAFPLPEALEKLSGHFTSFGGHALAGGMTLKEGEFSNFQSAVEKLATEKLGAEEKSPHLHIDAEIQLESVNYSLAQQLKKLEPYGIGNARPLFVVKGLGTENVKLMGAGQKHVRGTLLHNKARINFVAFGMADKYEQFTQIPAIDVVGRVEENTWNGRTNTELHLVDIRPSL